MLFLLDFYESCVFGVCTFLYALIDYVLMYFKIYSLYVYVRILSRSGDSRWLQIEHSRAGYYSPGFERDLADN